MKTLLYAFVLAGLLSACAPATKGPVVPIETGKDPACVKGCAAKQKKCVEGARYASARAVQERCYDGYALCVKACQAE